MRIFVSFLLAAATFSLNLFGTITPNAQALDAVSRKTALARSVDVMSRVELIGASVPDAQTVQSGEPFKFTKADLELLEQANLLDERLEKEGRRWPSLPRS